MDKKIVFIGIGPETGKQVEYDNALDYGMRNCGLGFLPDAEKAPENKDFKEAFVEWYFSGNWIREEVYE